MKKLSLRFADILIKILIVVNVIAAIVGVIALFMFGEVGGFQLSLDQTLDIKRSNPGILLGPEVNLLIMLGLIKTGLILLVLFTGARIVKNFRNGMVFNLGIANRIKNLAYWIIVLVIFSGVSSIISSGLKHETLEFSFDSNFLLILLLVTVIYVLADIIKKGALMKAENELTI